MLTLREMARLVKMELSPKKTKEAWEYVEQNPEYIDVIDGIKEDMETHNLETSKEFLEWSKKESVQDIRNFNSFTSGQMSENKTK